jgi:hypothetical protein
VRVYIPGSLEMLARWVENGQVPASSEYFLADDESEEAEYAAMEAAVFEAADFLAVPGRRVVVVADAVPAGEPGNEHVAAVPINKILAVHSDTDDVDPLADELPDLAWFATQEIPDLLA